MIGGDGADGSRRRAIAYLPPDIMSMTSTFDPTRAYRPRPGSTVAA